MLDLDQSTPDHENCYPNIEVMEGSKVKNIVEASDKNNKFNYYHYLWIFYLHAFQDEAYKNGLQ